VRRGGKKGAQRGRKARRERRRRGRDGRIGREGKRGHPGARPPRNLSLGPPLGHIVENRKLNYAYARKSLPGTAPKELGVLWQNESTYQV